MLVLDGEPYAALGLQIGADELVAVAVDLGGNRLLTWRRAFAATTVPPTETLRAGHRPGPHRAGPHRRRTRPRRPVRRGAGGQCPGLAGLPVAAELGAALRDPQFAVGVDSVANLAALAEQRHGAYAGTTDLVHLTGGVTVAAGIIAAGRLLRGGRAPAAPTAA